MRMVIRPSWPVSAVEAMPEIADMERADGPICLKYWLAQTGSMHLDSQLWYDQASPTLLQYLTEWGRIDFNVQLQSLRQTSISVIRSISCEEATGHQQRIPGIIDFWGALHELHDVEASPTAIVFDRVFWGLLNYVPIDPKSGASLTASILRCPRQPEEDWFGSNNDLAGGRLWSVCEIALNEPDSWEGAQVQLSSYFEDLKEISDF